MKLHTITTNRYLPNVSELTAFEITFQDTIFEIISYYDLKLTDTSSMVLSMVLRKEWIVLPIEARPTNAWCDWLTCIAINFAKDLAKV